MTMGPKELSERPDVQDPPSTDVLAEVLDAMRLTTLMHGRFEVRAPWGLRFSGGDAAHFVVMGRGNARFEFDGRAPLALSAGDVAVLPHGGSHTLSDAEGSPIYVMQGGECERARMLGESIRMGGEGERTCLVTGSFRFGTHFRSPLFERLPSVLHIPADAPQQAVSSLMNTVQLLLAESTSTSPGSTVILSRLAEILLVQALRTHIAGSQEEALGLRALSDPPIARALSLIHQQPGEGWTVEGLASAVALSRSGFAARFSALVGDPPLEYLARWRMTKAAQFLRDGHLSLEEVARQVGYQSEASFNRAFKRWEGVAPGTYRRQARPRAPASPH
ncbi:MAG: AraC family transcriptional regulator [Cystobacter sp.]